MEPVVIVILVALAEYMVFSGLVGRTRAKYGIAAPAITGHGVFERTFRVHQNSLENLIVFVPAVWIFVAYVSPPWAAGVGVVYIVARAIYAQGYIAAAEKRGVGSGITGVVLMVLVIGGLVGAILTYL